MRISKANGRGALIRDEIKAVTSEAKGGKTYNARCTLRVRGNTIVREWSIFPYVPRVRKAGAS